MMFIQWTILVFGAILLVHQCCHALSTPASKHTLYDFMVSNNGARCRLIIYKKKLDESEVRIAHPKEIGMIKSEEYLRLNPEGKVPTLLIQETGMGIPESDTIARYLMSTYAHIGPSFLPDNYKSNMIARLHDMYLTSIQACMYKDAPPFGQFQTRQDALDEFCRQLEILDRYVVGPYLCGQEVSLADASLFPTAIFANYCLPKFGIANPLPPKLKIWFDTMISTDADFQKVYDEVMEGLVGWDQREPSRWSNIWLAGWRDEEPSTIFDRIVAKEIPATIVKEDETILAFQDINPAAPAHVLVIPKNRSGLSCIRKASPEHTELLGKLLVAAGEIASDSSLGFGDGARLTINDGPDGGQEVPHLHIHVLGGRSMTWPPG